MAKVLKEYESIKIVKHLMYRPLKNKIELKTLLTYTPPEGGKGWIIQISTKK